MKKILYFMILMTVIATTFYSCKDEEDDPQPVMVTMGAQDNASIGGFYSVADNKVYTMDQGYQIQDKIDLLCFYELEGGNNIALASPGSGIKDIFTGNTSVENWTTQNTTFFSTTAVTPEQFDALTLSDALIESSFDDENKRKKAKDLKVDDVFAIMTQSGQYGLFKVTSVTQGANGSVTFELKMKI